MEKWITIYKGDEYRAKIAKEIRENDVFASSYIRAFAIMDQIISELKEDRERQDESVNGMGNNIIVFSGQRGQGKTSIMQSFAKWLKESIKEKEIFKNAKNMDIEKALVGRVKQNEFIVLESIDPSSLAKEESILQVLITRLFYLFDQYRQNCYGREGSFHSATDEREWMRSVKDLVQLFQRCFTNIDYLKMGRSREWSLDNLEELSQISSSAAFKENLKKLIDKLLELLIEEKGKNKFLVIPIDDTDLATQEVFHICEDIRNYLAISNVIVLMAVDYKQLIYAVTRNYLVSYDKLVDCPAIELDGKGCYRIAMQYLEKILPVGHRIDLPQIEAIINEKPDSVSFQYLDKDGIDIWEEMDSTNGTYKGMQAKLAKIIYYRTGIMFCDKQVRNAFFPRKMRELTHFVKLLGDMDNQVICSEVYRNTDQKMILQLKQNIEMLRQYFLDYWCTKNLSSSQKESLERLDIVMRSHDKKAVVAELHQLYKAFRKSQLFYNYKSDSFDNLFQEVLKSNIDESLQAALKVYYTLSVNMWYAEILEENKEYQILETFFDRILYTPNKENLTQYYNLIEFGIDATLLEQATDQGKIKSFLDLFVYQNDNESVFSLLKPLMRLMTLKEIKVDKTQTEESTGKDGKEKEKEENYIKDNRDYFIYVKDIVANYDVRRAVSGEVSAFSENEPEPMDCVDYMAEFYKLFSNEEIVSYGLLAQEKNIADTVRNYINEYKDLLEIVYQGKIKSVEDKETDEVGELPYTPMDDDLFDMEIEDDVYGTAVIENGEQ